MENGYYFDTNTFSINLEGRGRKIPFLAIFLIAPIIGLAFLMFLPFIGFYLVAKEIVVRMYTAVEHLIHMPAAVGTANLTGHDSGEKIKSDVLVDIQKEIDSRRR
jgi:hypothetical protein